MAYLSHTRVFDFVVEELDTISALVYGVVWRHCQMEKGECFAMASTLAQKTGLGESTVRKHLRILRRRGYILCTKPSTQHSPPHYVCLRGPEPEDEYGRVLPGSSLDSQGAI